MSKLKSFLQESKQEFGRVNWPTKQETIRMVMIVFTISIVAAIFLGLLDIGFTLGIKSLAS